MTDCHGQRFKPIINERYDPVMGRVAMCHVLNSYSNFYFRFPMSQDGRRGFQKDVGEEIDAIRDKKIRAIQVSEITF